MRHPRDWDGVEWMLAALAVLSVLTICQCAISWAQVWMLFQG